MLCVCACGAISNSTRKKKSAEKLLCKVRSAHCPIEVRLRSHLSDERCVCEIPTPPENVNSKSAASDRLNRLVSVTYDFFRSLDSVDIDMSLFIFSIFIYFLPNSRFIFSVVRACLVWFGMFYFLIWFWWRSTVWWLRSAHSVRARHHRTDA